MTAAEKTKPNMYSFTPSEHLQGKIIGYYYAEEGIAVRSDLSLVPFETIRGQLVRLMEGEYLNFCVKRFLDRPYKRKPVIIKGTLDDPSSVQISGIPCDTYLELREPQDTLSKYYNSHGRAINIKCYLRNGEILWETTLIRA